jgi:hypothetical protein
MINYKEKLNKKDEQTLENILEDLTDYYTDFYITKDNFRIFLKENINELYKAIQNGDSIAYNKEGIALTYGKKSSYRTYLKMIGGDLDNILKTLLWNINQDLYAKLKKNNPAIEILYKYGFKIEGFRGKEILLKRGIK